ncbi:hypothetical protein ACQ4PT_010947 [Festuca glaucescens]
METDAIIIRRRVMTGGVDCNGATANQSAALDHIHGYYKEALHRLPPELVPSLLDAGFCFGFLDPVSNIIANTVSHDLHKRSQNRKKRSRAGISKNGEKSESRRAAISKIITESSKDILLIPRPSDSTNALLLNSSIAARSLRGLVAFLTSYFRYLTTWDALRYLVLSGADLLVAVHLIQEVRDACTFTIHNPTARIALRCAAISALHPAVDALVSRSFLLASRADEASKPRRDTGLHQRFHYRETVLLTSTTTDMISRGSPMQQAIARLQHRKAKAVTRLQRRKMENFPVGAGLQISLKMALLDKIHLLYLEAISRIPKHELRSRHHRGLLKAGHCYGPCDPVTNIILNTICPQVGETLWSTPEVKLVLSSSDVLTISETLSQKLPPGKSLKKARKLSNRATKIISAYRKEFEACQGTIIKMAEAALLIYAKQGQEYELHFICDVNSTIPEDGVGYCPHSYRYPFSHMNILARPRGSQNDQVPTLFFIQCSNSDEHMQDKAFLCCPISDPSKDAGRCYHCEYDGIKIIHPSSKCYLGHCTDFEEMARGESAVNAQGLVEEGQRNTLFDGTLEYEDSIYFDPAWDVDFRMFIDQTARDQAR